MGLYYKGIQMSGDVAKEARALGYLITPIETFDDWDATNNENFPSVIARSIVEDPDYLTTFTNIINELDTDIQAECNSSYDTVLNTVSAWVDLSRIDLLFNNKYGNDPPEFNCKYKIYIKVELI